MVKYFVTLLVIALTLASSADPVARVQAIDGGRNLFYKEQAQQPEYRAHVEMDTHQGNHLRTDPQSLATLRFFLGGLANIDKGTEVAIVSERDLDVVSRTVTVKKGNLWARFDKQKAPIKIQTAGGAMGIRGTEFVVQVDPEGKTTLSVLEGEIEVFPAVGEVALAGAGSEVRMGPNDELRVLAKTVLELEERLAQECPQLYQLREVLLETRELHQDLRETEFTVAATSREVNLAHRRIHEGLLKQKGGGSSAHDTGVSTGRADDLLAELEAKMERTANKSPSETATSGPPAGELFFEWAGLPGQRFALMILDEKDDNQVHWLDYTANTSYSYPADAKPLPAGVYRYRVIPMDAQGNHQGRAVEALFETRG